VQLNGWPAAWARNSPLRACYWLAAPNDEGYLGTQRRQGRHNRAYDYPAI
jgi:hypothetical protein